MKTIAVSGGKGGVGKTSVSANLAVALAEAEHKVLIIDADLGLANLDIALGMHAERNLKHVVRDQVPLHEIVVSGPSGIDLVPGGSGILELADLSSEEMESLVEQFGTLASRYEFVVIDTAAGLGRHVTAFLQVADLSILVCTPEPTSLMDCYACAKALFHVNPDASAALLVNMADDEAQGRTVFEKLKTIIGQFLNKDVLFAGTIVRDEHVLAGTRKREPFVTLFPNSRPTRQIEAVAEWIVDGPKAEAPTPIGLLQRLRAAFAFLQSKDDEEDEPAEKPSRDVA